MPQWQGNWEEQPPAGCDGNAFGYRITRYLRAPVLDDLKQEIALGNDCLLAILVNQTFENCGTNGVIDWDGNTNWLGGHALWPYEYVDDAGYPGGGYVTIRNQWTADWGPLGGDARLTYNFLRSAAWMESWSYS